MSENLPVKEPAAISRFRAIVVAGLRVKQLRRGSKPRIELDDKKHKDTCIAMEEVRRGLISFTEFHLPHVHEANGIGDAKGAVEKSRPVIGSTAGF
jgi:DNA-directed RNA polymerase omega subunit